MATEVKDIEQRAETELAFMLTATEQEFNRAKKNASGSGSYGLISGNAKYGESKERARQIAQATKFDYKSSYASTYFSQSLSESALKNYVACLEKDKESPGLRIWPHELKGDFVTFRAFWVGVNTPQPDAKYDAEPVVAGGKVVSKPNVWFKGKTEEIVVQRNGNVDLFLNLKVGGQVKAQVIVKEPPAVVWDTKPVVSERLLTAASHGPNPGCTQGTTKDCIQPLRPGGYFVAGSAAMIESYTSSPQFYGEDYFTNKPIQICVKMSQGTGACGHHQSARGRLTALERFPRATE